MAESKKELPLTPTTRGEWVTGMKMDTGAYADPPGGPHMAGAADSPPANLPLGRALGRRGNACVGVTELCAT